jgi:hypothetical protein
MSVSCWEDERPALQAKFDNERELWQAQMNSNKENAAHAQKAKAERQALQNKEKAIQKKRQLYASSRPWCAKPYNNSPEFRAALETRWKQQYPRLSFAYSGSQLPQPQDFDNVP